MNWLDLVILIPCIWFFYRGFKNGFIKSVTELAALIIGIWIAVKFSDAVLGFCYNFFPKLEEQAENLSPALIKIIAFTAVFVIVIIIVNLIGKLLDKVIDMVSLSALNKIIGGIFGILKCALVISAIIYILNLFSILNPIIKEDVRDNSIFYTYVERIVPTISNIFIKKGAPPETDDTPFVYF